MGCYKLSKVWLCKLACLARGSEGHLILIEYEPSYLLVECDLEAGKSSAEVPAFKSIISGEMYFDGSSRGVFTPKDIGKTFVLDKLHIPLKYLEPKEVDSCKITETRIVQLSKVLFDSKLLK